MLDVDNSPIYVLKDPHGIELGRFLSLSVARAEAARLIAEGTIREAVVEWSAAEKTKRLRLKAGVATGNVAHTVPPTSTARTDDPAPSRDLANRITIGIAIVLVVMIVMLVLQGHR
ncbi:MAG: hypothetical protein P4M00_10805 [Azospirillaceae bacterium]|nr:hypothetical protein [Azospirillaceae bacterium]